MRRRSRAATRRSSRPSPPPKAPRRDRSAHFARISCTRPASSEPRPLVRPDRLIPCTSPARRRGVPASRHHSSCSGRLELASCGGLGLEPGDVGEPTLRRDTGRDPQPAWCSSREDALPRPPPAPEPPPRHQHHRTSAARTRSDLCQAAPACCQAREVDIPPIWARDHAPPSTNGVARAAAPYT